MKKYIITCYLLLATCYLHSQTANEIENLLQTKAITYAQAARFALQASEKLTTQDTNEAFQYAEQQGWLKGVAAEDQARLDRISRLLMNCFEQKGGLFYTVSKSPHHAYRELQHKTIIQGRTYPNQKVSGDLFLFMVNRLIADEEKISVHSAAATTRRAEREAQARRTALAQEITAILEEHNVQDTTVEATSQGVQITLSNIQFAADSARLPATETEKLREISNILKNLPGIKLQVTGHTARAGDEESSIRLSFERAQAVAAQLISFEAVDAENITVTGMGSARPIASNETQEGMAQNRRVEIMILE